MSFIKRTFTAEFKTKVVLEVSKGKKTINEITSREQPDP